MTSPPHELNSEQQCLNLPDQAQHTQTPLTDNMIGLIGVVSSYHTTVVQVQQQTATAAVRLCGVILSAWVTLSDCGETLT
jgi:hypothetical protein